MWCLIMSSGRRGVAVVQAFTTAARTTTTTRGRRGAAAAVIAHPSTTATSSRLFGTKAAATTKSAKASSSPQSQSPPTKTDQNNNAKLLNLSSVTKTELETVLVQGWGHPKFRVAQVWNWIREQGVTDPAKMTNLPPQLRQQLLDFTTPSALTLAVEQISKDGTIKRAYACADGQLIESVLMPYQDGRYTACISSQVGCAQGCVFCATGQQGFSRQLTSGEIFEQVARFAAELKQQNKLELLQNGGKKNSATHGKEKRLSNVVFMGMGEPLANYRNLVESVHRLTSELGIGARKITVSTVGIVPNIRKLTHDATLPQFRLAVSLHCATDEERSALLPANDRYGGLGELMDSLRDYIETTGRRITLEWALIQGQNDTPEVARQLGKLVRRSGLRKDMVHVNVIPLNPTGGFTGGPSARGRVNVFCDVLTTEYGIACTPRVRRGIDIDAGCGQLTTAVANEKKELDDKSSSDDDAAAAAAIVSEPFAVIDMAKVVGNQSPMVGVYEDDDDDEDDFALEFEDEENEDLFPADSVGAKAVVLNDEFSLDKSAVDFESDDYQDPVFDEDWQQDEAARLIALVKGSTATLGNSVVSSKKKKNKKKEPASVGATKGP